MGCQLTGMLSSKDRTAVVFHSCHLWKGSTVLVRTGEVKRSQILALPTLCWSPSLDTQQAGYCRVKGVKASSLVQFQGCGLAIHNPRHQDRKSSRDGGLRPGQLLELHELIDSNTFRKFRVLSFDWKPSSTFV